ncbi:MAG: ABC transporter ATP-binding protein, partial [Clostridia bacterium]|nr:ABC transporter ATP-binding protein [Clostridia bacterium]
LDAKLRVYMRTEIRRIQQQFGITAVYVTHDQSEAMSISDKIIIMNKGVIAQMGTPQEVYYRPASEFVADFIGEANFLKVKVDEVAADHVDINLNGVRFAATRPEAPIAKGDTKTLMLRPEGIRVSEKGILPCKVVLSCFMGSYQNYHVMVGDNLVKIADNHPVGRRVFNVGEEAYLDFSVVDTHLM